MPNSILDAEEKEVNSYVKMGAFGIDWGFILS